MDDVKDWRKKFKIERPNIKEKDMKDEFKLEFKEKIKEELKKIKDGLAKDGITHKCYDNFETKESRILIKLTYNLVLIFFIKINEGNITYNLNHEVNSHNFNTSSNIDNNLNFQTSQCFNQSNYDLISAYYSNSNQQNGYENIVMSSDIVLSNVQNGFVNNSYSSLHNVNPNYNNPGYDGNYIQWDFRENSNNLFSFTAHDINMSQQNENSNEFINSIKYNEQQIPLCNYHFYQNSNMTFSSLPSEFSNCNVIDVFGNGTNNPSHNNNLGSNYELYHFHNSNEQMNCFQNNREPTPEYVNANLITKFQSDFRRYFD